MMTRSLYSIVFLIGFVEAFSPASYYSSQSVSSSVEVCVVFPFVSELEGNNRTIKFICYNRSKR
jgi:hypothetical protein